MTNKTPKPLKNAHTPNTKRGMGDYYGTALPPKIGKMKEGVGFQEIAKVNLKKPPKAMA